MGKLTINCFFFLQSAGAECIRKYPESVLSTVLDVPTKIRDIVDQLLKVINALQAIEEKLQKELTN